jgi:heptosyltransferase-2
VSNPERILVVGPAWIGDMVMCQSLFVTLGQRSPGARIDVLAPGWSEALLRRMPEVGALIPLPMDHGELRLLAQWRVARRLKRTGYDRAIVTRRSAKAALMPWMAGIPLRTGILGERRYGLINDVRTISEETIPTAVARFAALGMEPGARPTITDVPWPRLQVDDRRGRELEERLGLEGEGPAVGLAPGAAFGPAKRWPVDQWRRLARALADRGRRVWIFGSSEEEGDGARIAEGGGPTVRNLCGRTGLEDVIDLMGRATAVVGNDSGLSHLAAAAGPRVVALFGPTSPHNAPPLGRDADALWLGLECSPCYRRECPLGHHRCLRDVPVSRVLEALEMTD